MDSGTIVVLIIAGIVVMVAVAFVAQTLENNRQERHRRVLALQEHSRQLWNALAIPPNYLTASLRQFILAELKRCYREILALESNNSAAASQLKNIDQTAQQPYEDQVDTLQPAFNDHMSGQKVRSDIKHLVNHIVQLHSEGLLDKSVAQQNINLGKALYRLASIDLSLLTAREMEHSENAKAALAHYSNCLKHLAKIHPFLNLPKRLSYLEGKVETLKSNVGTGTPSERDEEEANEWSKLMSSGQEDWKIKQEYE